MDRLYLVDWFYTRKRVMRIINKYPEDYEVLTLKNIALVFIIMILPIILGAIILNNT